MSDNSILLVDPLLRTKHKPLINDDKRKYDLPNGLISVASFLESKHIDSKIISMDYETIECERKDEDILYSYLEKCKPKIVGFTAYTIQYNDARRLARLVKNYDYRIKTAIGGHHAMHQAEDVLSEGIFDAVVIGEGEVTFYEYLKSTLEPDTLTNIDGLAWIDNHKRIHKNAKRERLDGSRIPDPNYRLLPEKLVKNANIYIITTRGCHHNCNFCVSSSQYGGKVEARSVKSVKCEIETLAKTYNHFTMSILDETLHDRPDLSELLHALRQCYKKYGVTFFCQTRAEDVVRRPEYLPLLRGAGIKYLCIGAESASDAILRAMNKGAEYSTTLTALKIIRGSGIGTGSYWIIGHPGSSYAEEMKTRDAIESLLQDELSDYIEVAYFVPYAGSPAIADPRIVGKTENFSKYNRFEEPVVDLAGFPRRQITEIYTQIMDVLDKYNKKNLILP